MGKLIYFEFRKLRGQKVFYISLAIIFAYTLLSSLITKFTYNFAAQFAGEDLATLPPVSSAELILSAVSDSLLVLLCAIAVPIIVVEDYEHGIVKNVYAKGYERGQVYFAKLVYSAACVTLLFIAEIICASLINGIVFGFEWVGGKGFGLICAQYLAFIATFSFYFAVSSSFKKTGASIAINIFMPSVVAILLDLITLALGNENLILTNYWISSLLSDLSSISVTSARITECMIIAVIYIGAFITGGYFINRNTEV